MKHADGSKSIRFRTSRSESDLQFVSRIDPSSSDTGPDRRSTTEGSIQRSVDTQQLARRYSIATITTICTVFLLLPLTVIGLSARTNVHVGEKTSRENTPGVEEVNITPEPVKRENGE